MTGLSGDKRDALAQLIERCPGGLLDRLASEAARLPGERGRDLFELVTAADVDRRRRERVFAPILPLFAPRADGIEALAFPADVLPRLWRLASTREPELLEWLDRDEGWVLAADRICLAAAAAVRDRPDAVWPGRSSDADAEELAGCLDLTALARRAPADLAAWLRDSSDGHGPALRLMVRDAAAIAPDGPVRLIEILFARLSEAGLAARILTQASSASGRAELLESSELAVFVERLLARLEALAVETAACRPEGEETAAGRLVAQIDWCARLIVELDMSLPMRPGGDWAERLAKARLRLSETASRLIRQVETAVGQALPLAPVRLAGRMSRRVPDLSAAPSGREMETARRLAPLVAALRASAPALGCEALRAAAEARLIESLGDYVDEALIMVNAGEAQDEARALALIDQAGGLLARLGAVEAGRIVRRRARAADGRLGAAS